MPFCKLWRVSPMLPDILPIAERHGLIFNLKTFGKRETLAKCPFCMEDSQPGKERKYYLSLNTKDQVFKCWYCGTSGGVFRFISLLEGIPESDVMAGYRKRTGQSGGYKPHPAERLSLHQYRLMGYQHKPDFVGLRKCDRHIYRSKRDECWQDWKTFVDEERRSAFQTLVVCIYTGNFQKAVQKIKKREKEIGAELLKPVLKLYSLPERPDWAEQAEGFALHVCDAEKYPFPSTEEQVKGARNEQKGA